MMKSLFCPILLLLLWLSNSCPAQETFSRRYDLGWPNMIFMGVVAEEEGYYVHGLCGGVSDDNIFFGYFDQSGEPQWQTIVDDSVRYSSWGKLYYDENREVFIAMMKTTRIHEPEGYYDLLIKYDKSGAIVDSSYFYVGYSNDFRELTQTRHGGVASNTHVHLENAESDFLVVKLDSAGDLLWKRTYPFPLTETARGICENEDGDLIINGVSTNVNLVDKNFISQNHILRIDGHTGELIHHRKTEIDRLLGDGPIIAVDDGYIAGIWQGEEQYLSAHRNYLANRPMVVKLDTAFNILWERTFFADEDKYYLWCTLDIIDLGDGEYVCSGMTSKRKMNGDTSRHKIVGFLAKFNEDGDSLWMQLYDAIHATKSAWQELNQVRRTADGGFIAAGQSFTYSGPQSTQSGWLVKTDSMGCLVPGCHVQVSVADRERGPDVRLWPNPTPDVLHVYTDHGRPLDLTIHDMEGRQVASYETMPGRGTWSFFLEDEAAGVYILTAVGEDGETYSERFVKLGK